MKYDPNEEYKVVDIFSKIDDIKCYLNVVSDRLTGHKRDESEAFKNYIFEHLDELKEMIKSKLI